jgi:hypothetical protein
MNRTPRIFRFFNSNRVSNTEERQDFWERNPSKVQFWATILILLATIYYSNQSLNETKKAYSIAKGQLDIAKEQFDSLKVANRRNDSANNIIAKRDSAKYSKDTIRVSRRDKYEKENFEFQQKNNHQQLIAIKQQADIAQKQFEFQNELNQQQLFNNRPVFFLTDVAVDSLKRGEIKANFRLKNLGKRIVNFSRSTIIVWNEKNAYFKVNQTLGASDLNPDGTNAVDVTSTMLSKMFDDKSTLYYLIVFYSDLDQNKSKTYKRFFNWRKGTDQQFLWDTLLPEDSLKFQNMISLKRLAYPHLTD